MIIGGVIMLTPPEAGSRYRSRMTASVSYERRRFPPEIIAHAGQWGLPNSTLHGVVFEILGFGARGLPIPALARDQRASEASTSAAARSPLSRAPCAVEKNSGEVASPAKNSLPSTGAASTARSPA